MKKNKKRVTSQIRVPVDLYINLRLRAMKQNITLSKYAEHILRMGVSDRKMNIVNK